ncbi:hypothetical protein [Occallatibacter savannae]|uniref:hypothetical protein n=1 Tax=Occallatibacter savannae TaxID=1002691 RepID=UPI000D69A664|nr:hypothetical protein [Occallatibacter savannae]
MKLRIVSLCAAALFALLPINATAQSAVTAYGGSTDVTLSSTLTSALSSLGVKIGYDHPAVVSGATATFPIVSGVIDLKTSAGTLLHSGSLTFDAASDNTKVSLQAFVISTASKTPVLSGEVVVNNAVWGRYNLFDLTLPAGTTLPLKPNGNTLWLKGVKLTLDPSMSAMLNKVYGVSQFTPGFEVGTANLSAVVGWNR